GINNDTGKFAIRPHDKDMIVDVAGIKCPYIHRLTAQVRRQSGQYFFQIEALTRVNALTQFILAKLAHNGAVRRERCESLDKDARKKNTPEHCRALSNSG
ncbi:MAG: hypothetical protein WA822_12200, partial [Albidovulum sp.]